MKNYDFLILGAGIFGLSTALALQKKGYTVGILNAGPIPDPLAASTDISKIIRMEYGSDIEYMKMAATSMETWREWNTLFQETLYHEVGFLLLAKHDLESEKQTFERLSYQNLRNQNYAPERISSTLLQNRFPHFNAAYYTDGFFHKVAGFAESGRTLEVLADYAKSLKIDLFLEEGSLCFNKEKSRIIGVKTQKGQLISAGHTIVCAGNFTPYLLPELKPFMRITGHPVFHLLPKNPEQFHANNFPVFAADISNSGWYGFPLHPREKVLKIASHTEGLELHPELDERVVGEEDIAALRAFLKQSIPNLWDAPIVYTRRCCYTDTLDGHFWIDRHPEVEGLTVGSGGSGHGFKMGPEVGEMIAQVAEGGTHEWSDRYQWRNLTASTVQKEEARSKRG